MREKGTTYWTTEGLPEALYHEKIAYYRETGLRENGAYQIGFSQTWMPYDYQSDMPDQWQLTYARLERPLWKGWRKFHLPLKGYLVIVMTNTDIDPATAWK